MKPPELLLFVPCTVCKPHGCCCSRCRRTVVCLCFLKTWRSSSGLGNDIEPKRRAQPTRRGKRTLALIRLHGYCLWVNVECLSYMPVVVAMVTEDPAASKQSTPQKLFFVGQIAQSVALVLVCKTYELVMSFCFFII